MELKISVADPAGNVTILVESPVARESYADVANRLLALPDTNAEQVGFLVPPRLGGDVRLQMMGGEFCGNALRSTALWHVRNSGLTGKQTVMTEISGCDTPLPVECDAANGSVTAQMPLPERLFTCDIAGEKLPAVCFAGIVHVIAGRAQARLSDDETRVALRSVCEQCGVGAAGLLLFDRDAGTMHPAVYVADTDTLVHENSCASGTTAVSAFLFGSEADGTHTLALRQPGGTLTTSTTVSGGKIERLTLGGIVTLTGGIIAEI